MSGQLRIRIVKRVATELGVAEVMLIDVPLDPAHWTKADDRAVTRLEQLVGMSRDSRE